MKKLVAFILVICLACALFGCAATMTPVENFLVATEKMDFSAMKAELVPDERVGSFYLKLKNMNPLTEGSVEALKSLYGYMEYTMGETSPAENGAKTVSVKIKIPDVERILTLAKAQLLVSGESAESIIMAMIDDGSVKNTLKEATFTVKMTETDGVWKIPYGDKENADFVKALSLAEMIDFMD